MTDQRHQHSHRAGAGRHSARSGAGNLRGDAPQSMTEGAGDRQAFAGEGAFTGRPIPPQEADPAAASAAAPPAAAEVGVASSDELAQLRAENGELTGHLQRMAADFDNFRKRARRDVEQAASFASGKLLGELLSVLDDLERAMEHVGDAAGSGFAEGVQMVQQRLAQVLAAHGLEEVDTSGSFDPHLHEAIGMQPAVGASEGQILQVVQKGYHVGDRVLRHARVIVAG